MKSQPVRMSHIPGWTKEEVGLCPLSDTAGMSMCMGRGTGRQNTMQSMAVSTFTSPVRSSFLLCTCIDLSFDWTCRLIGCPIGPNHNQPTEWKVKVRKVNIVSVITDPGRNVFSYKKVSVTSLLCVNTDLSMCSSFLILAGGVGSVYRLGNSNDQWGEWTAPTPSLWVAEAYRSKLGGMGLGIVGLHTGWPVQNDASRSEVSCVCVRVCTLFWS